MNATDPDLPTTLTPDTLAESPPTTDAAIPVKTRKRAPRKTAAKADVDAPAEGPPAQERGDVNAGEATVQAGPEAIPDAGEPTDAPAAAPGPGESASGPQPEVAAGPDRPGRRGRRRGRRGGTREGQATADDGEVVPPPVATPVDTTELFAHVTSDAYDVEGPEGDEEAATGEGPAPKRVLAAEPDAPKLHKVLAQAGVGSRRDMEQLIVEGRITVNGEPAHIGQRISYGDQIRVAGKQIRVRIAPPPARVLAYHKPAGEVVTNDDPQQRPTVFRKLPRLMQGKWQSVGRLDINTEGLLLFTNSGELANQLMHPRFGVEREYAVRVLGSLDDAARARLLEGVEVDGQPAAFRSVEDGGGEGANRWYRVVITEGRNREVRKLFDAVGLSVSRLIRIRYGSVVLPRGLRRGMWVDLDDADVRAIRRLAGPPQQGRAPGPDAPDRERDREREGERGKRRGKRGRGPKREVNEVGPIPNPLQQTFDKRAMKEQRARREYGEDGPIPNPLQQTFDKRALKDESALRREPDEDGPIPNPLQQTFDKRALKEQRSPRREVDENGPIPNPLQQTYDKRFIQKPRATGPGGGGGGGGSGGGGKKGGGAPRQPDPMQTSVGYIGADAFHKQISGGGGGRGRRRR